VGILEDLPAAARSDGLRVRPSGTPAATDDPFLRALKLPDFPVRWDPKVVQYLKFYRDDPRGRALMKVCLQRLGRYRPMIDRVLTRHRLPRDLVFLSMVESAFNPRAKSPAGATGLWQLMDQAAKIYGLSHTYWVDERRNPERSTEAAARFLKDLHARFGSWHLAMAAYNAGYGGVLQSIRRLNTNDYWELLRHENGLPWETALYVPKIIATAIVANNREAFGFGDVVEEPTVTYDKVAVPAATSLDAVSRAAGATLSEVTLLNSELHRERVPPAADGGRSNETYEVRIPRGTREQFLSAFAQANSGAVATHLMRFGERLDEVARSYGLSERELRRLNGVEDSTEVRAGVTLIVPSGAGLGGAAVALASATESLPSLVAVPDANFSIAGRERAFYRIKLGDTLEEIAQVFRVSVEDLEAWNSLDASARLQQDQVVQIFVAAGFERQQVALLPSEQVRVVTIGSDEHLDEVELRRGRRRVKYIVKDGDTMARIGRRFGLTPGDIGRINRMGNDDPPVGTELTVYVQTDKPLTATPSSMAARTVRPASRPPTAVEAEPAATRRAESTARTKSSAMYRVKSGDTLTKVAKTLGVSPAELAKANRLNLRGPLPAGSTLRIP
jgi:membrane-bound lytic murein transglycosylase D